MASTESLPPEWLVCCCCCMMWPFGAIADVVLLRGIASCVHLLEADLSNNLALAVVSIISAVWWRPQYLAHWSALNPLAGSVSVADAPISCKQTVDTQRWKRKGNKTLMKKYLAFNSHGSGVWGWKWRSYLRTATVWPTLFVPEVPLSLKAWIQGCFWHRCWVPCTSLAACLRFPFDLKAMKKKLVVKIKLKEL